MKSMSTVTLELDDELLARARQLAAARNMTVSEMLQRLLHILAEPPVRRADLPPLTRQALGMLPSITDERVQQILDEERLHKYGS